MTQRAEQDKINQYQVHSIDTFEDFAQWFAKETFHLNSKIGEISQNQKGNQGN